MSAKILKISLVGTFHTFITDPSYMKHINLDIEGLKKLAWAYSKFDPLILSYETGFMKPEKEIYEKTLSKLKLKGEECVFIDDRGEHHSSPEQLGMQTIVFKNATQLKQDLKNVGVDF